MRRWTRFVARAIAALCFGYFVLWACAPMTTSPPPVPLAADRPNEIGIAGHGGWMNNTPCYSGSCVREPTATFGADAWYLRRLSPRWDLGAALAGGSKTAFSGGARVRLRVNDPDAPVYLGTELSLGWLWLQLGLPISVPLGENLAFYTRPALGASYLGLDQIPVGLSLKASELSRVNLEVGAWGLITGPFALDLYSSGPIFYGALGYGARF